jgi:hypothetical protein
MVPERNSPDIREVIVAPYRVVYRLFPGRRGSCGSGTLALAGNGELAGEVPFQFHGAVEHAEDVQQITSCHVDNAVVPLRAGYACLARKGSCTHSAGAETG